jgi:hypothetical protein
MKFNNGITKKTKILLACGPAGSILFVLMFLIQGQVRKDYSALKIPISSLSIGELGWIQVANFLISGLLILLFAIGFRKATPLLKDSGWTSIFIGASGGGLIGTGFFRTDPVFGYPATEPFTISQFTITGHLHNFFAILILLSLPISCLKLRNRFKEANNTAWARYSMISAISMIAAFVIAIIGFSQVRGLVDVAGVFQRLLAIIGFTWLTALSFFIMRSSKQLQ